MNSRSDQLPDVSGLRTRADVSWNSKTPFNEAQRGLTFDLSGGAAVRLKEGLGRADPVKELRLRPTRLELALEAEAKPTGDFDLVLLLPGLTY